MTSPAPRSEPQEKNLRIAEYVCGLLKPEEHAEVHVLLSRDDAALAEALAWEAALLALVDALPPVPPEPAVRERLQRTLDIGPPPALQPPSQPQLLRRPSREPANRAAAATRATATAPVTVPTPQPSLADSHLSEMPETSEADTSQPSSYADGHHQAAGLLQDAPVSPPTLADAPEAGKKNRPSLTATVPGSAPGNRPSLPADKPASTGPIQTDVAPAVQSSPAAVFSKAPEPAFHPAAAQPETDATAPASEPVPSAISRPADASPNRGASRQLWLWRLIAICAAGAAVAGFLRPNEPPPPPVQIVKVAPTRAAILQAPGTTSTPGWTATLGPEGNLMMQPLVYTEVPAGSQVLLWTRSERVPEPRLLGRIDPNQTVQVPAQQLGALSDNQLLEITLETDEDAAQGVPQGPILFIGQMTVFGSEGAASPAKADIPSSEQAAASQ